MSAQRGRLPRGCLPRGVSACKGVYTTPPVDRILATLLKHYLSATTVADGNYPWFFGVCIITAHNEVGARLCFYMCVILFTEGSASVHAEIHASPEQTPPGTRHPPQSTVCWEIRSTGADSTHPTGMHSCYSCHITSFYCTFGCQSCAQTRVHSAILVLTPPTMPHTIKFIGWLGRHICR